MEDSIFTKIIRGDIPAEKIYEDDKTLVVLDIDPLSDGHVLVISKKQVDPVWDLPDEYYDAMWQTVRMMARRMTKVFGGVRIGSIVEGFSIPHAHIHLVPLYDLEVIHLHHGYPVNNSTENRNRLVEALKLD